jgi:hypothetical protein
LDLRNTLKLGRVIWLLQRLDDLLVPVNVLQEMLRINAAEASIALSNLAKPMK